jgi:hypothetical protein
MSGRKLDLRKATIAQLAQLFPACFYVARRQRRPLKIGIRRDLAALDLRIGRRELGFSCSFCSTLSLTRRAARAASFSRACASSASLTTPAGAPRPSTNTSPCRRGAINRGSSACHRVSDTECCATIKNRPSQERLPLALNEARLRRRCLVCLQV